MVHNRLFALIWRSLAAVLGVAGLVLLFALTESIGSFFELFIYFTVQSNIILAVLFVLLAYKTLGQFKTCGIKGEAFCFNPIIQVGIFFLTTITFLVYASMLSGGSFSMSSSQLRLHSISNILVHYIVPIMGIIDFILFVPHGKIPYKKAIIWLSYPFAYLVFILFRAAVGDRLIGGFADTVSGLHSYYPYPFIDLEKLGVKNFIITVIFFVVMFYSLALLFVFIDKRLASLNAKIRKLS